MGDDAGAAPKRDAERLIVREPDVPADDSIHEAVNALHEPGTGGSVADRDSV